jgi:uncharacterized protein (DUF2062 family)
MRLRELFDRARSEHSSPPKVGFSVAAGVFSGCTPFLGLHMWIALGLATIFRLNRLWAFLGSRTPILPVFMWIAFCEIELGHRLRTGSWAAIEPREALTHGPQLFHDWLLGAAFVATTLGALAGLLAYRLASRPISLRRLSGLLRPSSESRPSAPPAPKA